MPRTISRVLSENISNSGENSRVISRISSMSRWFSSGKADPDAKASVGGQPVSNASVSGPSEPHPMLHPVPPRLHTVDEDSTSQEDAMPARRREIRFYDEPEPRPADVVASSSESVPPLYTVPQASPPGVELPEPKAVDPRPMELGTFPSESHPHSE
jgi:hypothetical protein